MEEINEELDQEIVETGDENEQVENTENTEPIEKTEETKPEKTFTQSEINEMIEKRITRERETITKKTAQEARDSYIAEQNYEWNGKPIKTEAEYKEALHEQELREKYSDLPEDVQNELIESKKFRNEHKAKETAAEQRVREYEEKEKNDAILRDFVKEYPDVKELPQPVIDDMNNGANLLDAYARYENKTLKEQLAALKEGKEIEKQNADNELASTGSVRGQGEIKPARFTQEQIAKMSDAEMNKNWKAVNESLKAMKK